MCLGNFLTFHGSVLSEEGEEERERADTTVSSAQVLQRFVLLSLRKHFITLPPSLPLSLSSSHPSSGEPDEYRRRTKHSCLTHTYTHIHTKAAVPGIPHLPFLLSPSVTFLSCPILMPCLHLHDYL
ncbi:hypothetical protein XENOCAPTIV_006519 [Xenoophorus captivus]|uniref:Uncharacterized protein n=1 Tax=Xenoophorus captivus TaxID=1517983 RepID=A0ABV0QVW3_9TELE